MPTQVTYWAPGHQEAIGPVPVCVRLERPQPGHVLGALARNTVTMCRQAATNVDGGTWL